MSQRQSTFIIADLGATGIESQFTAKVKIPAAFAELMPAILSSKTIASVGLIPILFKTNKYGSAIGLPRAVSSPETIVSIRFIIFNFSNPNRIADKDEEEQTAIRKPLSNKAFINSEAPSIVLISSCIILDANKAIRLHMSSRSS